jgi:hypothetical protein
MIGYLPLVLTGIGIIVSILYYTNVLRNANKARLRELVFQRGQTYSFEYLNSFAETMRLTDWKTGEEFYQKYGPTTNPEKWARYAHVTNLYNIAGVMLKENMAEEELIFTLYPPFAIIRLYEQFEPTFTNMREDTNYQKFYEPFEFLYKRAKQKYPDVRKSSN